jgi:2-C-methyl-D-erythritol 4-phosphate cytidylyltransferase
MAVALIVAAGSGERLGAGRPKAWVDLCGRPLLAWSIDALARSPSVARVIVARPPGYAGPPGDSGGELAPGGAALAPGGGEVSLDFVDGGSSRSESVRRALQALGDEAQELVLVHDAARPLLSAALVEAVIAALQADPGADAAIAASPVTDTIKRAGRDGGTVRETLDRGELWSVQTPQVFRRAALERALQVDPETLARATDDAWLIEQAGGRVIVVPSPPENLKVTTPVDLRLAAMLLTERGGEVPADPA